MFFIDIGCGHYKFHIKKHELHEEHVIRAELHLLQNSTTLDGHYDVEILNRKTHGSPIQLSFNRIDSTPGWKTFDITPIVLNWKQGLVNHGLQIKLTKEGKALSCEGVFTEEQNSLEKPSLVVFTHDHRSDSFVNGLKNERANHIATDQQRTRRNSNSSAAKNASTTLENVSVKNVECHLKEKIIQTESLNTDNIHVLLPKQFNAGECDGYCKKLDPKILQRNTITSHADALALYYHNTEGVKGAPSRCCKATSFKMVPMVFYDEAVKEMIIKVTVPAEATKCGCL